MSDSISVEDMEMLAGHLAILEDDLVQVEALRAELEHIENRLDTIRDDIDQAHKFFVQKGR